MRLIVVMALLSVAPPTCGRLNPDYCDKDTPCEDTTKFCRRIDKSALRAGVCETPACTDSSGCNEDPQKPTCELEGDFASHRCIPCTTNDHCKRFATPPGDGRGPYCQASTGRCVECPYDANTPQGGSDKCVDPSRPACSPSGVCQPCQLHKDCRDRGLCVKDDTLSGQGYAKGSCIAAAHVIEVDPKTLSEDCARSSNPRCNTIKAAVDRLSADLLYIRVNSLSGLPEAARIDKAGPPVHLVGPYADSSPATSPATPPSFSLAPASALDDFAVLVAGGRDVTVEGLILGAGSRTGDGVRCVQASRARVQRAVIAGTFGPNYFGVNIQDKCRVDIDESWIGLWSGYSAAVGNQRAVQVADDGSLRMVNSVVHWNGSRTEYGNISFVRAGTSPSSIINSTLVTNLDSALSYQALLVSCDMQRQLTFFNNYLLVRADARRAADPVAVVHPVSDLCLVKGQYGFLATDDPELAPTGNPEKNVLITNATADLRNLGMNDLRLKADADARVARGGTRQLGGQASPEVDIERRPRPKEGSVAIGASEP